MIETYPDTFAVIEYHVGADGYDLPWGNARGEFYNIWSDGIPWFAYDGLFDAWPINTYESKFITRQAVPTDLHIDVIVQETRANTYEVIGQFCVEEGGQARTARVYAVQVLDHWPASPSYSRNTFKQAGETVDLELMPGLCAYYVWQFTLDADSQAQIDDVKFAVWAQEPLNGIPAEIFQAKIVPAVTIEPCPADVNSDQVVNIDDLFQVLGAWGPCADCPEDINDSGAVDIDDIFEVLGGWGPC